MSRSTNDLLRMLPDLETDQVERKESLKGGEIKDRICQAICAFANDLPDHHSSGVIFVGASDDGRPAGLSIDDRLLLSLADLRGDGRILPPPVMNVRRLEVGDQAVAAIEVEPSPSPPVRFNGQVWIRVGPRRAVATADEERRLAERRRAADLPFDSRPADGATLGDLDLALFEREYLPSVLTSEVLAANGRTTEQRLASLRLATVDGVPTNAGLLILGTDPARFISGAQVQFVRVEGTSLSDPIVDERRLTSALPDLLRELDELLRLNIRTSVRIGEALRDVRRSDYPLAALQQLTRNAILHRNYEGTASPVRLTWYEDRVEIFSPGGPYGTVTVENFGQPGVTDYRNPILAEAMGGLGFVQRFGAGLPIARRALAENGSPPPEFTPDPSYVGVIIREAA
ncbi:putative DNA binding domain-containing protein [Natronosporangium hydrolyticum]|uniref:Putative DNA binding domain-containing protein n=1 Tax=Natronosporangium hydrolyticum TaxID=2811111 RepID=A0A895YFY5_9ACTN|nr:ATP-binding protein [Natronosporangium hydrolyticum]QSB16727.1 putative DNA binding domain-containing protein [Natronosporangium hydrolyticum]